MRAGDFVSRKINEVSAPLFRELGNLVGSKTISNLFPVGYRFGLLNDAEENEIIRRDNMHRNAAATWVSSLNGAGWDVNKEELEKIFKLKLTASIPERKLLEERISETTIKRLDEEGNPEKPA
jgi:hypothetical protein